MKSMMASIGLTVLLGALVALGVTAVHLEPATRGSALLGAGVSTLLGVGALTIKVQFSKLVAPGSSGIKALMGGQVLSFLLRLLAVGVGAVALKADPDSSPAGFVLAFFAVYLTQQFVETRSLLASYATKSGVS
jgi:hypothetical protein